MLCSHWCKQDRLVRPYPNLSICLTSLEAEMATIMNYDHGHVVVERGQLERGQLIGWSRIFKSRFDGLGCLLFTSCLLRLLVPITSSLPACCSPFAHSRIFIARHVIGIVVVFAILLTFGLACACALALAALDK
jgi:hypothetical protein